MLPEALLGVARGSCKHNQSDWKFKGRPSLLLSFLNYFLEIRIFNEETETVRNNKIVFLIDMLVRHHWLKRKGVRRSRSSLTISKGNSIDRTNSQTRRTCFRIGGKCRYSTHNLNIQWRDGDFQNKTNEALWNQICNFKPTCLFVWNKKKLWLHHTS